MVAIVTIAVMVVVIGVVLIVALIIVVVVVAICDYGGDGNSYRSGIMLMVVLVIALMVTSLVMVLVLFTNPSARAGYDTRSIFKRSLTGFEFRVFLLLD